LNIDRITENTEEHWDLEIVPKHSLFSINLKEIWRYRDLLKMFIRRDVVTVYKQTILGPIWFVVQPIMTTIIFMFVFGGIAKISTDGAPQLLFYMAGITIWSYFADTFNATSQTFKQNEQIFGKVYFPRLIIPLSKVIGGLIKFGIQFLMFLVFLAVFMVIRSDVHPNWTLVFFPLLIVFMAGFGIGTGVLFTSLTSKYRDLNFLLSFIVQLLMYASAVIFPLTSVPEKYKTLVLLNPFVHVIEAFKYMFLGVGHFTLIGMIYTGTLMLIILFLGVAVFSKTEKTFMDTV
jgi:lipopolysaccharide transport system permease protein